MVAAVAVGVGVFVVFVSSSKMPLVLKKCGLGFRLLGLGFMLILRIDSLESHRNLNPELRSHMTITLSLKWEFPKIGGTLFWGPYNKDPTI